MKKYTVSFFMSMAAAIAVAGEMSMELLDGECWWGGHSFKGRSMPYSSARPFSDTLIDNNSCNQTSGLLLSSKGRWIWNDEPFAFSFSNGVFKAKDNGRGVFVSGCAAEKTLRGAFRDASAKFFPADGKMPDPLLFTAPQWNTWVELTYNQNQRDVLAYAESIVKNGFKPGVLMVDDTWQHAYGVWDFNYKRFPDPKAMCDRLHAMGFKLMLWVCPYVGLDTWEVREELWTKEGCGCIRDKWGNLAVFHWWNGRSACVDFSSPLGVKWFSSKLDYLQREYGVDGFKFDAGDMSAYAFRFKAHTPEGSTAHGQSKAYGEFGARYPLNEYRTVWQLAGRPLAQRLQDKGNGWHDLKQCVADILACGVMGYAFCCPDMIGGGQWTVFHGDAVKNVNFKVVARSAQMQALMPMMQFSLNPWRVMTKPEDAKYLDAISKAAMIRARYEGKILALAEKAAKTGEPIAAHMEYAFPGNGFEHVRDQWALGEDMIVAPVLSQNDSRKVALPPGAWRDDLGAVHEGPAELTLENVPLDRLPFYERAD
jgi:alpha-glucosidase